MKKTLSCFAFLFLAGCTGAPQMSPSQNYVLGKEHLHIIGRLSPVQTTAQFLIGGENAKLTVWINGKKTIDGVLSNTQSGELDGKYKNHSVEALCSSHQETSNWISVNCSILIDQVQTVTLSF